MSFTLKRFKRKESFFFVEQCLSFVARIPKGLVVSSISLRVKQITITVHTIISSVCFSKRRIVTLNEESFAIKKCTHINLLPSTLDVDREDVFTLSLLGIQVGTWSVFWWKCFWIYLEANYGHMTVKVHMTQQRLIAELLHRCIYALCLSAVHV